MRRWTLYALLLFGCRDIDADGTATVPTSPHLPTASEHPASRCPDSPRAVDRAPGTDDRHRSLETWLGKVPESEGDRVLARPDDVRSFNRAGQTIDGAWRDPLGPTVADPDRVTAQLNERTAWLNDKVETGAYVEGIAGEWARAKRRASESRPLDRVHMVRTETPVWCAALDTGLFTPPRDDDFDRNRCASARVGEWARAIRETADADGKKWTLVHVGHGVGWLDPDRSLTPPIEPKRAIEARALPRVMVLRDGIRTETGQVLRLGTRLLSRGHPAGQSDEASVKVWIPTEGGLEPDRIKLGRDARLGPQPLTRRSAWGLALDQLDQPYGWGGMDGNRDCSRLLRDVFLPFGLEMARHSGVQAKQGHEVIGVQQFSESEKRAAIRDAATRGLVLLYMPGHIMLYLGEDGSESGRHLYAVSSISEFLEPCDDGDDTVNRLDRVAVTTLDLGRGTERTAFIERITQIVVIGAAPADGPAGAGEPEPGASDQSPGSNKNG